MLFNQVFNQLDISFMATHTADGVEEPGFQRRLNILELPPNLPITGRHGLNAEAELMVLNRHSQLIRDGLDTVLVPLKQEFKRRLHRVRRSRLKRRRLLINNHTLNRR